MVNTYSMRTTIPPPTTIPAVELIPTAEVIVRVRPQDRGRVRKKGWGKTLIRGGAQEVGRTTR